jgi:hypothetical protein
MKLLLTFALLLTTWVGWGQSGTPAQRLLTRAWKAHVPGGTLRTLTIELNGLVAQSEMILDTVGFLQAMGVPPDSLDLAISQLKTGPALRPPASLRSKPQEYVEFDLDQTRLALVRVFRRTADGATRDSLRWVIRQGQVKAWHQPRPEPASLESWFSLATPSPLVLIRMLRTTDSLTYLGRVSFRGTAYEVLDVSSQGIRYRFYFDPKSALLQHLNVQNRNSPSPRPDQEEGTTYSYQAYYRTDTVRVPRRYVEETFWDPHVRTRMSTPYGTVRVNRPLTEHLFVF